VTGVLAFLLAKGPTHTTQKWVMSICVVLCSKCVVLVNKRPVIVGTGLKALLTLELYGL